MLFRSTAVDTYREGDGFMVALKKNTSVSSKKVVLCTGNQPPVTLPGITDLKTTNDIYINPWDEKAVENIHPNQPVFIIGSGLTMVDTVISLVDQGFKNKIIVLSKHGAIPMAHPKVRVVAPHPEQAPPADLHIIYKNLKSQIRSAIDHTEWHEPVLEAVRPFTQKIWQEMPLEQKHRFLRHINHRWAKLRHRLPHEVHDLIQSMIDKGQIELYAGKLSAVQYANQTLNVSFYNRAKDVTVQCEVQRIINCIGPEGDFEKVDNPLLQIGRAHV